MAYTLSTFSKNPTTIGQTEKYFQAIQLACDYYKLQIPDDSSQLTVDYPYSTVITVAGKWQITFYLHRSP